MPFAERPRCETASGSEGSLVGSSAVDEAERNLTLKRPEAVPRLRTLMTSVEIKSLLVPLDEGHGLPPKDVPILAAAVGSQCAMLLTGDLADFGHLIGRTLQGVRILTASMLLADMEPPA